MIDTSNDSNGTPAHKAVEASRYEALTVLLASGTDPHERCFGHTLLTHALGVEGDGRLPASLISRNSVCRRSSEAIGDHELRNVEQK
ncbi:hypothetical protein ACFVT1_31555 [Streptomyces sp. NPDC057963]|uniref:hypothetical protein n=1 Tax=Streptomyces sp. NPDC057963 TaxID=3346290 RepID=UPI0036DFC403